MSASRNPSQLSRRQFLIMSASATAGAALLAACAPGAANPPAESSGDGAAPSGEAVTLVAHMVQKQDVSDWIQTGLDGNIGGFNDDNPGVTVELETVPGWTPEYIPKILSLTAAGTLGDAVWFPPRHRSHIAWGTEFDLVTDLRPLADAAGYVIEDNFFEGAIEVNSFEGSMYWMSFISEPIVPVIAYNKTRVAEMGIGEPTDEWTFDELVDWAQTGTSDGTFGYYRADGGSAYGGAPYFRQWGVQMTDETGTQATFLENEEGFVNALAYRQNLIHEWAVSPAGNPEGPEVFGSQNVLAVDIWPFRITIYPNTFTDFEMDFVLTPKVNVDDERRSMLNEHVFGVTTASQHHQEAFNFVTWIAGHEMNVQGVIQGQKGPIARQDFWADERVYEAIPTFRKLQPIMESIEPDFLVANFRGEEFDQAFQEVYDLVELNEVTPEEAAQRIQELCQAVLDKEPA